MDIETLGMTFNGKCNMISQRYVDMLIQRSVAGFGSIQNNVIHRLNQFLIDMRHQLLILLLLLRFGQNEHLLGSGGRDKVFILPVKAYSLANNNNLAMLRMLRYDYIIVQHFSHL